MQLATMVVMGGVLLQLVVPSVNLHSTVSGHLRQGLSIALDLYTK
jgi:hypothetical protein